MVRLVFGASNLFDWNSTVLTGRTLAYFSISLFAQAQVHLIARGFFALHDSKTPVVVGAISVVINTLLSLLLILFYHFDVWSLALSASVASIFNAVTLLYLLDRKIGHFNRYHLLVPGLKILLSGAVAGAGLYIPIKLLDQLVFDTTRTINLIILTGISTIVGLSVYLFLAWFLEVPQVIILSKLFRRVKSIRQGVLIDTTQEVVNTNQTQI